MPYTRFQFIAYQTPTINIVPSVVDRRESLIIPLEPGDPCDTVTDIPVEMSSELSSDSRKRLLRFAAVVDRADKSSDIIKGDDTLKVFVAPEFYFRPNDNINSYTYSAMERAEIVYNLGRMFKNARFDHWLIIAGTILANIRVNFDAGPEKYFYNTAVVVKGGAHGWLSTIEKQQPSGIDGVPIEGGIAAPEAAEGRYKIHYCDWSVQKKREFIVDGIHCGLDICLDHQGPFANQAADGRLVPIDKLRVAKHVASRKYKEDKTEIFLHILTAGGMPIIEQSVAAKIGGYILRTDGNPGMNPHTDLRRAEGYTLTTSKGVNLDTTPDNMFSGNPQLVRLPDGSDKLDFPNCARAKLTPIKTRAFIQLTGKLKMPYTAFYADNRMEQKIVVYPPMLLR